MLEWLVAHWTEIFGFTTGVACVYLAARRRRLNFVFGVVSAAVFMVVFFEVALYADMALQVVYIVLGVTGWIGWSRARADDTLVATVRTPTRSIPILVAAFVAITALLAVILSTFTDSQTAIADAATTAGSLVAQFMLNRRWIESWFVWIAVDIAYIGLYIHKELYITAALYLVFIAICVHGFLTWRRAPHEAAARESAAVHA